MPGKNAATHLCAAVGELCLTFPGYEGPGSTRIPGLVVITLSIPL